MKMIRTTSLALTLALVAAGAEPAAAAPPTDIGEAGDPDRLSPEDRAALDAALGADAAAAPEAREPSYAASSGTTPTGYAAVLQSLNPDISFIFDGALAYFSGEPLQVGAHDPNETGFTFQQLEMHVESSVDPFFRFEANIVLSQFGVEVEEAYATTLDLPCQLQLRAGQLLTRFGRLNDTHPHSWHFADQPLVNGKFFGGEGSRGVGMELSWLTPLPWYAEVIGSATDAAGAATARSFFGADDLGVESLEDLLYTVAMKHFFPLSDDWSLAWGVSAQLGPNPTGHGNRSEIYGSDVYLRYRPIGHAGRTSVSLTVEGMYRTRQTPGDVLGDWGMYSSIVWQVDSQWEVGARHDYVSGAEGDYLDVDQRGDRHRFATAVTFYPSHFSRLRLQGAADLPSWRDEPVWAGIVALEVLIGAHGAHGY